MSRKRARVAPRAPEAMDIQTADGWSLRADVYAPAGASGEAAGVVVLAHAMMARRTEFDRPRGMGLAPYLAARGWCVIPFDFRMHGDSAPGPGQTATYGYDDLVMQDLPAVCAFARSRARRRQPVIVLGHSLGGHVAFAAQGSRAIAVDGIVGLGAAVWLRRLEPSRRRWWIKRGVAAAITEVTKRVGRFPARALRLGSDDEPRAYIEDIARFVRSGQWVSADGRVDYFAALAEVRVPVLQVVSEGDVLECAPACGARFVAACGGPCDVVRIARDDDGGPPPSHMGIVTSGRVRKTWERLEAWMRTVGTPSR